jgi:hypothetical protein
VKGVHRCRVGGERVVDECARDDDADDRHPDEAGDASDGVVDGGRDPGVALVRIGEDGGDERGDRERQSEGSGRSPTRPRTAEAPRTHSTS